jgi:YHS domain-containing protein
VLQTLQTGVWFEPEDLWERVQDRDADFLFAERSKVESYRGSWYYSYSGSHYYGSTRELIRAFDEYESSFLASCVTGFLHHLGVVDVGLKKAAWQAFRLTEIGEAVLGARDIQPPDRPAKEDLGKLVIQPNFQLVAMGPVGLDCLARLDLVADRERADRGAFEYRLSRDSIYRAHKLGMEVNEVIHFLEEASGISLPQNIRRSLQEWGAQHERIIFRSGVSLLQAADAGLLAGLLDDSRASGYLDRKVSPAVALLKSGQERNLVAELVSQGVFPVVSGSEPESADDSVVVDEDGSIRPAQTVPSLYLSGRLSRMAEERAGGFWKLTPASVNKAGGSKDRVLRLLDELGRLGRGALPSELADRIKAWGGYYGHAATETVTLIEFRDPDALRELRKHPDLHPYLMVFRAGDRALAVVDRDCLAAVQETLSRLGVQVRDGLSR